MAFETITARWKGYTPAKKWLLGTAGVILALGIAGAGEDQGTAGTAGTGRWAQQQQTGAMMAGGYARGPAAGYSGGGNPDSGSGYAGGGAQGYAPPPTAYAAPPASSYAAQDSQPADITSGYEARQRSQTSRRAPSASISATRPT